MLKLVNQYYQRGDYHTASITEACNHKLWTAQEQLEMIQRHENGEEVEMSEFEELFEMQNTEGLAQDTQMSLKALCRVFHESGQNQAHEDVKELKRTLKEKTTKWEAIATNLEGEVERFKSVIQMIDDIRNSIVAFQTVNWSEHIYPLVTILEAAGFKGMEYPAAKDKFKPILERAETAEADSKRFREALEKIASDDNTELMEYFEVGQTAPSLPRIYEDIACKALIDTEGKEG
jgi:malonyl CoA-acyl carrier protein transacylase